MVQSAIVTKMNAKGTFSRKLAWHREAISRLSGSGALIDSEIAGLVGCEMGQLTDRYVADNLEKYGRQFSPDVMLIFDTLGDDTGRQEKVIECEWSGPGAGDDYR